MRPLPHPIGLIISLVVLAALFFLLHQLSSSRRGRPFLRREWKLDLAYWFFTPWVTGLATRAVVVLTVAPLIFVLGISIDSLRKNAYHGFGPLSHQPAMLQALEIFLLGDLIAY